MIFFIPTEKFAIFISNNCAIGGAKNRVIYVEELMKYIPVDSYGICLNNKKLQGNDYFAINVNLIVEDDLINVADKDHGRFTKQLITIISGNSEN